MFDFSFAEFSVVVIVGVIMLGPHEMISIIKQLRHKYNDFQQWLQSYWHNLETEYIKDLNDNWQQTYDIEEVLSKIEEAQLRQLVKKEDGISKANQKNAA
jgi:Sec-independent protein translocase protein TatA